MRMAALFTLLVVAGTAPAAEKLGGTWTKKTEGFTLTIAFKSDDKLQFSMDDGNDGCTIDAKYTVDNDGTVKCELTKFEKKGNFPVDKEVGYKFSFKPEIKGTKAKVSNFEGKDIDDQAKAVLEGDYTKKD